MSPRVLIETYGCTLNQADSEIMGSLLKDRGYEVDYGTYDSRKSCDYVIVNTCTVKAPTEQKALLRISRLKALGKRLVVAGCMAGANAKKIADAAPEASLIAPYSIGKICDALDLIKKGERATYTEPSAEDKPALSTNSNPLSPMIARIPISDGCLSNCSFCETKAARGPLNSFSEKRILDLVRSSVARGAREMDLTAQDTGAYGLDRKTNIAELVAKASLIDGDFRIRIGMLNPEHLHKYFDDLVKAYGSEKVYKFIHLPLQSGSDSVLNDMGRRYSAEAFGSYVRELRKKIPGISLETDIIVGYPTETKDDFNETVELIKEVKPEVSNVSRFSARPHARATKLKQVCSEEIKRRSIGMSSLVRSIQEKSRRSFVGSELKVLITEKNSRSFVGRSENYLQVAVKGEKFSLGEFAEIRITDSTFAYLIG
jgi:threonylcarbamoyladenosine tRNA methylthiotransferase CDKAL1